MGKPNSFIDAITEILINSPEYQNYIEQVKFAWWRNPLTQELGDDSIMLSPTKGDDMRASDAIKEHRSYVVQRKNGQLYVKGSHWQPGYSAGHCATPREAVEQALADAEKDMAKIQARVVELHALAAIVEETP